VAGGGQDAVAYLFRGFDGRVGRVGDADEHADCGAELDEHQSAWP
jgi:hypothetical protein